MRPVLMWAGTQLVALLFAISSLFRSVVRTYHESSA